MIKRGMLVKAKPDWSVVEINDLNENFHLPYEMTKIWSDLELSYLNTNLTDDTNIFILNCILNVLSQAILVKIWPYIFPILVIINA